MKQIEKIQAVKRALEAADPDPSFLEAAADKRAAKGRAQYICPHCGHGAHGDGLQWRTAAIWHCYTCGKDHDLIDLMGAHNGLTNAAEAAEACRQYFNLSIPELNNQGGRAWNDRPLSWEESERAVDFDGSQQRQQAQRPEGRGQAVNAQQQKGAPTETKEAQKLNDTNIITHYLGVCAGRVSQTDYLTAVRKLTQGVIEASGLGYDPDFPRNAPVTEEGRQRYIEKQRQIAEANAKTAGREFNPDTWQAPAPETVTPWKVYGVPGGLTFPAIIIPADDGEFIARATNPAADERIRRYYYSPRRTLFNSAALSSGRPVFLTEGQIDALSILSAGGKACALGSTGNSLIYPALEAVHPKTVIIALDNDAPGQQAAQRLAAELGNIVKHPGLAGLRVRIVLPSFYGAAKDANEALINDPEFPARVMAEEAAAVDAEHEEERKEEAEYMAEHEAGFAALLEEQKDMTPRIKTGFWTLDDAIGGGLRHSRTYTIAAMPSVGKSTFILQLACSIAANYDTNKRDVLFFGLEMSETELMAKCVSFLTAQEAIEAHNNHYWRKHKVFVDNQLTCDNQIYAIQNNLQRFHYDDMKPQYFEDGEEGFEAWLGTMYQAARQAGAVSANAIEEGLKFSRLWDNQKEQVGAAMRKYHDEIHPHMFIFQGGFSIPDICAAIDRHIAIRKRQDPDMLPPVIFIDYLQILDKVDGEKYTSDKDKLDQDSKALKQIAVHYRTPVWCVSSVNRAAYNQGGEMTALKGSGEIEFNADFIFFLVFSRLGYDGYDFNREKGRPVRSVMLQMRKSRSERASDSPIYFSYFPEWNYYAGSLTPPPRPLKEEGHMNANDNHGIPFTFWDALGEVTGLYAHPERGTVAAVAKALKWKQSEVKALIAEHPDDLKIIEGGIIDTVEKYDPEKEAADMKQGAEPEGKEPPAAAEAGDAGADSAGYDDSYDENSPF